MTFIFFNLFKRALFKTSTPEDLAAVLSSNAYTLERMLRHIRSSIALTSP